MTSNVDSPAGRSKKTDAVFFRLASDEDGEFEFREPEQSEVHPIGLAVGSFIHRVLDIEQCFEQFVASAHREHHSRRSESWKIFAGLNDRLSVEQTVEGKIRVQSQIRAVMRTIERQMASSPKEVLERSLFISIFAHYDKFLGELVAALYGASPKLFNAMSKEIPLSEVLGYASIEELKAVVLEKEIESIKRKSYVEQFKELEKRFDISTLRKFDSWSLFVEAGQRRNLFTHCDGVVSDQYMSMCSEHGLKGLSVNVGDRLGLSSEYFYSVTKMVVEVAVMLAHTLWRKVVPSEMEVSDLFLNRAIFDFLHLERWPNSIALAKFAYSLPRWSSDVYARMYCINYAIALDAIGERQAAKTVLDKQDWSAATLDFKLAYSVLCYDYDAARQLMIRIGKKGDYIGELAYHDWPLFRKFRESESFLQGYEAVYGYEYSQKLSELAEDVEKDVESDAQAAEGLV